MRMGGGDGTGAFPSDLGPSGDGWLDSVPQHWELRRLKYVCRLNYGNALASDARKEGQVVVWGSNGPIGFHNVPNSDGPCIIVGRKGSFGKINFSSHPVFAIDTTFFVDCCSTSVVIRWLYYILGWLQLDEVTKDSAVPGLDREDAYKRVVAVPPRGEQSAIVRFLDHADRRIQSYIRTKERLIELLEEQRQAIIHQAVTGQIDVRTGQPYPAYKDSGVEWLGEVPEHWALSRVKGEFQCLNRKRVPLSSVERGKMTSRRYDYYGASGIIDKVDDYLFDDELLLIAEDGANLVMRNLPLAIVARGRFWVNNHAHILKPRRGNIEFLAWIMEDLSYLPWISGAAQPKLTQDRLMGIAIAVPSRDEQDEVMALLKDETVRLTDAVTQAHQEIALASEYRTRLIADVVTGKLDVREAATSFPETDPLTADDPSDNPEIQVTTQGDMPNPAHSHP